MRKPMVTRTFTSTKVVAMCVDINDAKEVFNKEFILAGTYPTIEKLEKAVKKQFETEALKIVSIVSDSEVTELRGMSENDFLANSILLDNETRKPIEQ